MLMNSTFLEMESNNLHGILKQIRAWLRTLDHKMIGGFFELTENIQSNMTQVPNIRPPVFLKRLL